MRAQTNTGARVNESATRTERATNGRATRTDKMARVGELAFAITRWRQSSVSYSATFKGVGLSSVVDRAARKQQVLPLVSHGR